ncbi:hypothetical protein IFM89_010716, partial [Coptis chinensis]
MLNSIKGSLNCLYVVFAFISALLLGALKGVIFGPIAALVLIIGNVGVILGLFPYHVAWTVYTLVKTNRFDVPLKITLLLALPVFFGIWLGLGIACSVLLGAGYGFFTPWVSTFEAFRQDTESGKFWHFALWFVHIPHVLPMGLIGLLVEIPLYTIIAIVKSPYLLFIGWKDLSEEVQAYVVAMVAEFDEYTNDGLYPRKGLYYQ